MYVSVPELSSFHPHGDPWRLGVGGGIGDRPMSRLALWSIRTVLALEPFLALDIAPGADYTCEYTYRYYTIP